MSRRRLSSPPERFSPNRALPTLPASPSKRRERLRESEEAEGEMSIERYLYRIDDFRKSSFAHPLPLPWKLETPESHETLRSPQFLSLIPNIREALEEYGIDTTSRDWSLHMEYLSKPGYPHSDRRRLTLIIIVTHDPRILKLRWGQAKDTILALIRKNKLPHEVELIDFDKTYRPCLFALPSQHAVCQEYERLRLTLLQIVDDKLAGQWTAMCVFNSGRNLDKAQPTLVVFVRPGTAHNWQQLGLILTARFNENLKVEFLPGGVSYTMEEGYEEMETHCSENEAEPPEPKSGKAFDVNDQSLRPSMGASVGEVGQSGGGTLGGFVNLTIEDQVHRGWLTNHHVTSSQLWDRDAKSLEARFGHGGPECQSIVPATMQYPALADLTATQYQELKERNWIKGIIRGLADKKYKATMGGRPWTHLDEVDLKSGKEDLAERNTAKALTDAMPYPLGRVLFSSGTLTDATGTSGPPAPDSNEILDWSFVELPDSDWSHSLQNRLPSPSSREFEDHQPRDYGINALDYRVRGDQAKPACFGAINPDQWYFKVGRTTGITTGKCNGVAIDLPFNSEAARSRPDGQEVSKSDLLRYKKRKDKSKDPEKTAPLLPETPGKSRAHVLLVETTNHRLKETYSVMFSQPGDSGSFVFDNRGTVCGLLFGHINKDLGGLFEHEVEEDKSLERKLEGKSADLATYRANLVTQRNLVCNSVVTYDAGLVTSMDTVIRSIEAKTKGRLSLP